jgi:hypothetical protein
LRWATTSGYPLWVFGDVLCDARRDAGSLINGTADFALVPGPLRRSLLQLRRMRLFVQIVTAVFALIGVARWVTVWLQTGGTQPATNIAYFWSVPLLALFVLYFLLGLPEYRVRRREHIKATGRASGESPPLKSELVKMWMASAERARKSLSGDPTGKTDGGG